MSNQKFLSTTRAQMGLFHVYSMCESKFWCQSIHIDVMLGQPNPSGEINYVWYFLNLKEKEISQQN